MAVTRFAAIDIGSYNVIIEIFELSKKGGMKSVNRVRQRLELGTDTYRDKKLSREKLDKLCHILNDFNLIMKEYQVKDYRAYAKSAFREAKNCLMARDLIYQKTGIHIDVLSNSEQRFLGYKAIASRENDFNKIITKGTAIIDMGGGSVQVSLFDKDALVSTQNIQIGSMRTHQHMEELARQTTKSVELAEELIRKDIQTFKRLYLKDRKIQNVILVGDYFTNLIFHNNSDANKVITKETFMEWYRDIISKSAMNLAIDMNVPMEFASVILPTAVIYRRLIDELGAETIWLPGIQLTDGMAFDYGEKNEIIRPGHDFENDIVMAAKNIAKRYGSSQKHTQHLVMLAEKIFDSLKKPFHMGSREKLLLKIAILLHDCGKYISLLNVAECSYNIIMSTEIIGLSHTERVLIAHVVKYNTQEFVYYNEYREAMMLTKQEYLTVAKLTAILVLVNVLDRSHHQKITNLKAMIKDRQLILTVEYKGDFTVESGLFEHKAEFFEEVFSLKPVLKMKKSV